MKLGVICAFLLTISLAPAQQSPDRPAFEVASVKASDPNPSNPMWIGMDADAGMVRYTNITLKDCIRAAWRVRDFQIQGPAWLSDSRYEITAKLPAGASSDQIPDMLQTLLEERFKLMVRHDPKEESIYALVVGKAGPKLKPAQARPDSSGPQAVGPDGKPPGCDHVSNDSRRCQHDGSFRHARELCGNSIAFYLTSCPQFNRP